VKTTINHLYSSILFFSSILLLILFVILPGCVDAPNPIGAEILPETDLLLLKQDTLYATSHETRFFFSNNSSLDKFCVGKFQSYETWGLLGFFGLPDSLTNVRVLNASIRLKAAYHFGDSASNISFRAYRMVTSWVGDSLTLDSLRNFQSNYYDATPLQLSYSGAIGDTDYITIDIPDTSIVRQWLATVNDSTQYNYGLLLEPTNSSVIMGFASYYTLDTASMPTLTIEYEKDGEVQTYVHYYSLSRFLSSPTPTSASFSTIIKDSSEFFYAQNGIPYRGTLTFDVSSIPNPSNINSGFLYLTLEPTRSLSNNYMHDSVMVTQLNSDGTLSYPWISLSSVTTDSLGNRVYKIDIKKGIAYWIRKYYPAQIVIFGYGESSSFDRFAFYGSQASINLKPRLEILYSTR